MVSISISPEERQQGALDEANVLKAVQAIQELGFVVIEDAVDPEHVAILRERVLSDVEKLLARPDRPFNWNSGNLQQDPPPFPPYLFRDVLANEYAIQVTHRILGNGMYNGMYSGNTALPSESRQPVHADIGHLWPNLTVTHPPYALVVNLPLVDMGPENGSTEIWPGTHHDPSVTVQDGFIEVSEEKMAEWRAKYPPLQPRVKAGSLLIRDIRMWHAGMPNRTDTPRPMVAMIHYVGWWNAGRIQLHESAQELLMHPILRQHAEYTAENPDHISAPGAYSYQEK